MKKTGIVVVAIALLGSGLRTYNHINNEIKYQENEKSISEVMATTYKPTISYSTDNSVSKEKLVAEANEAKREADISILNSMIELLLVQDGVQELTGKIYSIEVNETETKIVLDLYKEMKDGDVRFQSSNKQVTYNKISDSFMGSYYSSKNDNNIYYTQSIDGIIKAFNEASQQDKENQFYKVYVKNQVIEYIAAVGTSEK